jgi:transglutaminase-like putative cysteine protease
MGLWGTPVQVSVRSTNPINTDRSTADTIQQMKAIARISAHSPRVGYVAYVISLGLPSDASQRDIARAIWHWVHDNVRFVLDEDLMSQMGIDVWHPTKELLITPDTLLSMPQPSGDCDDFSTLTAALLLHFHIRCCFVTIAADDQEPGKWSHVYCRAYLSDEPRGSYINMDASHGQWPDWESPKWKRKKEWFI